MTTLTRENGKRSWKFMRKIAELTRQRSQNWAKRHSTWRFTRAPEKVSSRDWSSWSWEAAAGSIELCECVVRVDKSLVRVRDKDGETPIFRAVHYARNKTFFFLHSVLIEDALDVQECYSCCKRDDGRTILHDAIISENFSELYKKKKIIVYVV